MARFTPEQLRRGLVKGYVPGPSVDEQLAQTAKTLAARKIVNGVDPLLANVSAGNSPALPEPVSKLVDIALNRPSQALLAAATENAKNPDEGFINQLVHGGQEFVQGLEGNRPDATGSAYLSAKGWEGNGIGKQLAGGALDIFSNPIFPGVMALGKGAVRGLPLASEIGKSLAATSAAGGIYNGLEGVANQGTPGEILKSAGTGAAEWPLAELGFRGAGKAIGKIAGETSGAINRGLNKIESNDMLNWRDTPTLSKGATKVEPALIGTKGKRIEIPGKMEQLPNGQKVRSTGVSMANAEWTDATTKDALINEMSPGMRGAYNPIKLKEVDAQAQAMISKNPQEAIRFVMEAKNPDALHTATGIRLVENLQNTGNYEQAIDVAMTLSQNLTKSGQAISAARITGALKPNGVLIFAQRQINKINRERKLPGITEEKKLTPQDAENLKKLAEIMQSAEGDAKIEASQELQGALQALKPSGILRKVDTAQTIAQLLNPKTIVTRNPLGNEMFYRLERINKLVATPIDWAKSQLTGADRTVTFAKAGQTGYWDGFFTGAKAGWKGVNPKGIQTQYDLGHGLAFNPNPQRVVEAKNVFSKTAGTILDAGERTMSFFERALGATLKGFDFAAYNRAYNQTIGEMATLRAMNEGVGGNKALVDKYIQEADDNMKNIADQYGKYVTFQDDNVISQGLSKVKRGMNFGLDWGFGSMLLKYPKTPGALVMRGIEYSPAGFLRSAYQLAKVKGIMKGESTDREVMLALGRAITGTAGLTGMGYFLADQGIITGSASNDKDVRALQQQVGQGAYTANVSALVRLVGSGFNPEASKPIKGDRIINYDWAQPIAMALAMGANIHDSIAEKVNPAESVGNIVSDSITGLAGGIDTIAQQPVLQGLQKLSTSYPGESVANKIGRVITETARDVPSSFVPTLSNQVRSAVDNQRRTTYDPNMMAEGLNKAKTKIPGIADNLPKAYDTLGNKSKTYQADNNNLFNVFLNPAFVTKYNPSPAAQLVIDIYNNTGETKQVPRVVNDYFKITVKGESKRIDLTGAEYSELQRIVGQETARGFDKINSSANDGAKIKRMLAVMEDAGSKGKKAILKARGINWNP